MSSSDEKQLIENLTKIVEEHLGDENFGVNELADKLGMSRVTLHRKVKSAIDKPVSEFIREYRLERAKELLQQKAGTVSEVAFRVGFGSDSYFNRCFSNYFGYSPGEVRKGMHTPEDEEKQSDNTKAKKLLKSNVIFISIIVILTGTLLAFYIKNRQNNNLEKSIAILPPVYIGADSTYIYQLDGTVLMILDDLSLIGEIKKIVPWISVQKYKNSIKTAAEIAEELDVNYIVETNGVAMEDNINLSIKLLNGKNENQIAYYHYEVSNEEFIKLPMNIARMIANEINAGITSEEKGKIEKMPTQNTTAWRFYLRGRELFDLGLSEFYQKGDISSAYMQDLETGYITFNQAAQNFKNALEYDKQFAQAYAQLAITYFIMDFDNSIKKYSSEININADKAIIYDAQNDICMIAKACDYMEKDNNKLAIPYLERAIQYNPNSTTAYRFLANIYNLMREANTEKYLEYKLRAVKINELDENLIQKSEDYRLAARALRVAGFFDEAETYIEKSIEFNPRNFSAICEKQENIIEKENNYEKAREVLFDALKIDSTNTALLRYLFTNYYLSGDYQNALNYFQKIQNIDSTLRILATKDFSRLAVCYKKLGIVDEYEKYKRKYNESDRTYDNSYTSSLEFLRLYCLENNTTKAMEQLNIFKQQRYHFKYSLRMLKDDPVFDTIRNLSEFQQALEEMEKKFWKDHEQTKANLLSKELL